MDAAYDNTAPVVVLAGDWRAFMQWRSLYVVALSLDIFFDVCLKARAARFVEMPPLRGAFKQRGFYREDRGGDCYFIVVHLFEVSHAEANVPP